MVRASTIAKLLGGPLQKSAFSVTGKIFQATSHCNSIVLRMVSIIHNESRLAYGENEAGFRLLSLTRTRGWGQPLLPGRQEGLTALLFLLLLGG